MRIMIEADILLRKGVGLMRKDKILMRAIFGCWIAIFLISIVGCGEDEFTQAPSQPVQAAAKKTLEEKESDADAAGQKAKVTKQIWTYDPTGKRDPFEVLYQEIDGEQDLATRYDLDQMWLDGIVWGAGKDVAHIVLPSKEAIFITVGDELGINHGRVKQIRGNQVVVEEIYVDPANPSEIHIIEKILEMREAKKKKGR